LLKIRSNVEARLLFKDVGKKPIMQVNGTASMNAPLHIKGRNVAVTTILPSQKPLSELGYTKVSISKQNFTRLAIRALAQTKEVKRMTIKFKVFTRSGNIYWNIIFLVSLEIGGFYREFSLCKQRESPHRLALNFYS